jgi:hypothetical protein
MSVKTCDPEVYQLALYLLQDKVRPAPRVVQAYELARAIQQAVEDWLEEEGL